MPSKVADWILKPDALSFEFFDANGTSRHLPIFFIENSTIQSTQHNDSAHLARRPSSTGGEKQCTDADVECRRERLANKSWESISSAPKCASQFIWNLKFPGVISVDTGLWVVDLYPSPPSSSSLSSEWIFTPKRKWTRTTSDTESWIDSSCFFLKLNFPSRIRRCFSCANDQELSPSPSPSQFHPSSINSGNDSDPFNDSEMRMQISKWYLSAIKWLII